MDQGKVMPCAQSVHGACEQAFSGTGLAENEDCQVGFGDLVDLRKDPAQGHTMADQGLLIEGFGLAKDLETGIRLDF